MLLYPAYKQIFLVLFKCNYLSVVQELHITLIVVVRRRRLRKVHVGGQMVIKPNVGKIKESLRGTKK